MKKVAKKLTPEQLLSIDQLMNKNRCKHNLINKWYGVYCNICKKKWLKNN